MRHVPYIVRKSLASMDAKRLILLLVAGVVVAFAAIMMRTWLSSEGEPAPAPSGNHVIVARRDMPLGSFVQVGQDIDWMEVAPEAIKEDYLREGAVRIEDFNGAVVRRPLRAGEPVLQSSLMRAGEGGFMSAVLEPGMRAVSIAVNATSGNAGFISPGDRVDLIVTHRIRSSSGSASDGVVASETFVRGVRVIAVDQMLDNPENKAILAKTVTVEVTSQQAEKISVASEMGKISMVLRSVAQEAIDEKNPVVELYGVTSEGDVSQSGDGGSVSSIRVIRGNEVENIQLH